MGGQRLIVERATGIARRSTLATLAALSLLVTLVPEASAGEWLTNRAIFHDGTFRWFDVYEPDGLGTEALPVLLLLHGGTQDKFAMRLGAPSEFITLADQEGFILLVPNGSEADGATGILGNFNWNDCRGDAVDVLPETDDVGFISALLDWTEAEYDVDSERIYATGASNGGMMSYRLALEMSDRFAAIGVQIANMPAVSDCPVSLPGSPISVLIMNGTADPLVDWEGGMIADDRGTVISAVATRDFWRSFLGTSPTSTYTLYPEVDPTDGGRVESDLYDGGLGGSEVLFYTVNGGGHNYPSVIHELSPLFVPGLGVQNRDVESADEVWNFLSRHVRVPEPGLAGSLYAGLLGLALMTRRRLERRSSSPLSSEFEALLRPLRPSRLSRLLRPLRPLRR